MVVFTFIYPGMGKIKNKSLFTTAAWQKEGTLRERGKGDINLYLLTGVVKWCIFIELFYPKHITFTHTFIHRKQRQTKHRALQGLILCQVPGLMT